MTIAVVGQQARSERIPLPFQTEARSLGRVDARIAAALGPPEAGFRLQRLLIDAEQAELAQFQRPGSGVRGIEADAIQAGLQPRAQRRGDIQVEVEGHREARAEAARRSRLHAQVLALASELHLGGQAGGRPGAIQNQPLPRVGRFENDADVRQECARRVPVAGLRCDGRQRRPGGQPQHPCGEAAQALDLRLSCSGRGHLR